MIGPGTQLGRYQLREPLGVGGMSAVYLAYDPMLDREVAIKILPAELAKEAIYRRRFEEEARALGRVDHPNLIRIFTVGQEKDVSYYAMERVRGMSLRNLLKVRAPLTLEEAMAVFGQFLRGLKAVHDGGIVHRDVKPGNIMLAETGRAILMDFGLARRTDRDALTQAGAVLGTPEYMSPEQAKGEEADIRSDLYAAGVVLFEMLGGRPPFGGKDTLSILRKHVETPAPPLSDLAPHVPSEIEAIVVRLLEKKPEDRFRDAAALLDALAEWLPDGRNAENLLKRTLAEADETQRRLTRSFVDMGAATERAESKGARASHGSSPQVPVAAVAPPRRQFARLSWLAIVMALIAVAVAFGGLLAPEPEGAPVWRRVTLRDGESFVAHTLAVETQPDGDAVWLLQRRREGQVRVPASDIRRMTRARRPLRTNPVALILALAALAVAVVVVLQSRRTPPRAARAAP